MVGCSCAHAWCRHEVVDVAEDSHRCVLYTHAHVCMYTTVLSFRTPLPIGIDESSASLAQPSPSPTLSPSRALHLRTQTQSLPGTFSGLVAMLLAAAAVALASPSSVACCGSIRGASRTPASYSNTLSHIFSRDFLSEHNVAMLLAMLAAAGIETSTDQLDNLVCCMAHVAPYTSHLTPHTSHLTGAAAVDGCSGSRSL